MDSSPPPGLLPKRPDPSVKSVLVHRPSSIGDSVVALPALRLIAAAFPQAKRCLLTIEPQNGEKPLKSVLGIGDPDSGTGALFHHIISYPIYLRRWADIKALKTEIARFAPERVLYLVNTLGRKRVYRDAAFLTLVGGGGKHLPIGLPLGKDRFHPRPGEREAARLLRCLDSLGTADLSHPSNWDLGISAAETAQAEARLRSGPPGLLDQPLLMAGAGAKVPAKDWGAERWGAFLRQAREMLPNGPGPMGLLLCGGPDERPRFEALAQHWPSRSEGGGPVDIITDPPRITAALCAHPLVKAFVGHDGGPMHLAAAAGCPTIGLFAGTDHYGRWTPLGPPGKQRTMEHPVPCAPCFSLTCKTPGHPCLAEITPTQLWQNLLDILNQDRVET